MKTTLFILTIITFIIVATKINSHFSSKDMHLSLKNIEALANGEDLSADTPVMIF